MDAAFFNPTALVTVTGWTLLEATPNTKPVNIFGLGADGDKVADHTLPGRRDFSLKFVNYNKTDPMTLPQIGVTAACHIDKIDVDWDQEFPTMSINCHQHETVTPGAFAHAATSTYTPTLAVDCGVGTLAIEALIADVDILSAKYSITAKHIDIINNGLLIACEDHDGEETFSITTHDVIADPTALYTALADALVDSHGSKLTNTSAIQGTYSVVKHIARDVVAP